MVWTPRVSAYVGEEGRKNNELNTPLRRVALPEDIAAALLFMVSDLSGYVNGQTLRRRRRRQRQVPLPHGLLSLGQAGSTSATAMTSKPALLPSGSGTSTQGSSTSSNSRRRARAMMACMT